MAVDYDEVKGWLTAGKVGLELLKTAVGFLPKGKDRDAAEAKLQEAEEALLRSDASLAKNLGYRLCRCTFPPQIMLWNKDERVSVCPSCGDRFPRTQPETGFEDDVIGARYRF